MSSYPLGNFLLCNIDIEVRIPLCAFLHHRRQSPNLILVLGLALGWFDNGIFDIAGQDRIIVVIPAIVCCAINGRPPN